MHRPPETACDRTLARLDAWDELTPLEHGLLEEHARGCAACALEFDLQRAISAGFRRLPRPACPPEVTARVLALAAREAVRLRGGGPLSLAAPWKRWPWRRWLEVAWQPALAACALALVALLPVVWSRQAGPARGVIPPSAAEVARAEQDLKLALAYLGQVTETAESTLRREMVDHVIAPTRRAWASEGPQPTARR